MPSRTGWHLATSGRCFTAVASLRTFASISCEWQVTGMHDQQCHTTGRDSKSVPPDHLHLRSSSVFAAPAHPCRPAFASCWTLQGCQLTEGPSIIVMELVSLKSSISKFTVCVHRQNPFETRTARSKGTFGMSRNSSETLVKPLREGCC